MSREKFLLGVGAFLILRSYFPRLVIDLSVKKATGQLFGGGRYRQDFQVLGGEGDRCNGGEGSLPCFGERRKKNQAAM